MDGLIFFGIIFAALVAFSVLAARFGVDSRLESRDPRRSEYPIGIY